MMQSKNECQRREGLFSTRQILDLLPGLVRGTHLKMKLNENIDIVRERKYFLKFGVLDLKIGHFRRLYICNKSLHIRIEISPTMNTMPSLKGSMVSLASSDASPPIVIIWYISRTARDIATKPACSKCVLSLLHPSQPTMNSSVRSVLNLSSLVLCSL